MFISICFIYGYFFRPEWLEISFYLKESNIKTISSDRSQLINKNIYIFLKCTISEIEAISRKCQITNEKGYYCSYYQLTKHQERCFFKRSLRSTGNWETGAKRLYITTWLAEKLVRRVLRKHMESKIHVQCNSAKNNKSIQCLYKYLNINVDQIPTKKNTFLKIIL